jgi:glycosyltransferase involved in cell wall biosynthesis
MFELFIAGAMGVVTHSQYARDQVRERFLGPVTAIPLPVVRDALPRVGAAAHDDDVVVVATIGQINPNKLVGAVIQAIGANASLRGRVRYVVVGPCPDAHRQELEEVVAALGLADVVDLRGRVSDAELTEVLVRADVCVNLRNPCLEAASASLGEAMWFGKPVIVTDAGCYSELPDDCVVKTDPEEPVASVGAALRRLVDDPALRTVFGERASAYAQANLRADRYASSLLPFIEEVMAARPFLAVADRFGEHMARLGMTGDMPVVDVTAALAHELFAGAALGATGPAGVRVEPSS